MAGKSEGNPSRLQGTKFWDHPGNKNPGPTVQHLKKNGARRHGPTKAEEMARKIVQQQNNFSQKGSTRTIKKHRRSGGGTQAKTKGTSCTKPKDSKGKGLGQNKNGGGTNGMAQNPLDALDKGLTTWSRNVSKAPTANHLWGKGKKYNQ